MTVSAGKVKTEAAGVQPGAVDFETLFEEHWPRVCAVIHRIIGDGDEAEDLALEVFWRLYRKMKGAPDPGSTLNLRGWLYRVATNLGLNALRGHKRRAQYETEAGKILLQAATARDPATELEQAEERRRVRWVLSQMKARSARLLTLRYSGLSHAEVATAMGVSPKSVGTLLARAEREFERHYRAMEGG